MCSTFVSCCVYTDERPEYRSHALQLVQNPKKIVRELKRVSPRIPVSPSGYLAEARSGL